ncbi:protein SLOW GREEN 1, chloroplastic [Linum perenne]
MASVSSICLRYHSQSQIPNPRFPSRSFSISLKPPIVSINPHRLPHSIPPSSSILKLCRVPDTPSSSFTRLKTLISASLARKCLVFLVGAFVFVGSLGISSPRLSLAVPAQTADSPEIESEEMYEKLLETEPRNVNALKTVVYGKMRRGRNGEAVQYVKRLIDIEPDEVEWRLLEALCFEMMGQLSKAKRLFKEILKERPLLIRALHVCFLDPCNASVCTCFDCVMYAELEFVMKQGHRFDQISRLLCRLNLLNSGDQGLAMVMHKNHEGPAVFERLNEALEIAHKKKRVTEERNIRILIAQMHVVMGYLEEGLSKFQDLIKEDPRDFRPYLCQGIIYSLMEKNDEAAEQFETYQSLVPDEFPQRGFLDDVVIASKDKSREWLQKEFGTAFSRKGKQ